MVDDPVETEDMLDAPLKFDLAYGLEGDISPSVCQPCPLPPPPPGYSDSNHREAGWKLPLDAAPPVGREEIPSGRAEPTDEDR